MQIATPNRHACTFGGDYFQGLEGLLPHSLGREQLLQGDGHLRFGGGTVSTVLSAFCILYPTPSSQIPETLSTRIETGCGGFGDPCMQLVT